MQEFDFLLGNIVADNNSNEKAPEFLDAKQA
jgi:hypothetical protein